MSAEEEFLRWLNRNEKSFLENFQFALKAWNSAEFTLSSKYELILHWIYAEAPKQPFEQMPYEEFLELLQMRAQPGLVSQITKESFVEMVLKLAKTWIEQGKTNNISSIWHKLLYRLCNFEVFQDLYRTKYDLHARVYATLLDCYELYLKQCNSKQSTVSEKSFSTTKEAEFFASIVTYLRDHIKRTGDVTQLNEHYISFIIQPLVRVILLLRMHTLCFFDDLLHLERLLTDQLSDEELVQRILKLPLHVRLLILECAIVNRRGVESFLHQLLLHVYQELPNQVEAHNREKTPLLLTAAAYTLEIFRKHDINLNFKMEVENQPPAMTYLGEQLLKCIQLCKKDFLKEVLMLLCATLRLNPLILEQNIFQITTWMIVAEKGNNEEHALFAEYLVSLMDMFRRLSRAEKLVFNMLKSLKEWLNKYKIPAASKARKSLKRKAGDTNENAATICSTNTNDDINYYLNIIFKEFHNVVSLSAKTKTNNAFECAFPQLRSTWPTESVGIAYSKLITGLVSKPALVIWKSLLYSLKELLENVEKEPEIAQQENNQFLLELHAALLCQYFAGCRLIEQYDKFSKEINEQLLLTDEVLKQFGLFVLTQEHSSHRILNAFLECAFYATNFLLLLNYYKPDGFDKEATPRLEGIHGFLNANEWAAVQQHALNCGKTQSKFLFNRLKLQCTQAQTLLPTNQDSTSTSNQNDAQKVLQTTADDNDKMPKDIAMLLEKMSSSAKWFISRMEQLEKSNLMQQLLDTPTTLAGTEEDLESFEILAIVLCVRTSNHFATAAKGSILAALKFDLAALSVYMRTDQNTADKELTKLIEIVETHASSAYKLKKQPNDEELEKIARLCRQLPLGHLRRQLKNLLFTMLIAFYSDLKSMHTIETDGYAVEVFEIIMDFLHFGQHVQIFKYFSLTTILNIFPVNDSWTFYEFVFSTIKSEEKGSEQFLTSLTNNLEIAQSADSKLGDDQRRLLLIAIETLAALSGPSAKRARKYFERLLAIYSKYIMQHFSKRRDSEIPDTSIDSYAKKDKKFVEKTLAGFAPYANAVLVNGANNDESVVDENFRRICKIYIGHSMDYRNPDALRLMQVALNHRQLLHLDQDEIEFVLSHYWQQLNADLKQFNILDANILKLTETTVKMIIGNKTNEDLLLTLQSLASNLDDLKDFSNILRCLELIAKCSFSTIKGAIFNEKFKSITSNIIMRFIRDEQQQFVDKEQLLTMLAAQQSLVENKMIPISTDTLDDILAFLMDINIKRLPITEDNLCIFKKLHLSMSDLLGALIRQRHILLMDRVPQFMHIFKDLIQSIVWYKSERQKDIALTETELEDLAELAMKLEALMHLIAAHSVHVKRVAPFVLTFVISLMVANKRTTTLYPKIKTHIDNVCYDLIGICDHRVGRFILRCSNEAARQVYELYVKDHKKYHKFKGKV